MQIHDVLLLESRPLLREAIKLVFSKFPESKVSPVNALGARFLKESSKVALVNFEDFDPFAFKTFLVNHKSAARRIVLYSSASSNSVTALGRQALQAGYRWIVTEADAESIELSMQALLRGTAYLSEGLTQLDPEADEQNDFSKRLSLRELEVLRRLAVGSSNRAVAAELGISVRTVETHRMRIKDKLEAKSFADIVRFALERKLVG